jgi:hypothetical protein
MNEIILAPCDVISKIKQNSSDMNEIILAPCDAGYVQSCTGFYTKRLFYMLKIVGVQSRTECRPWNVRAQQTGCCSPASVP